MRRKRWFWIGFLILLLMKMGGTLGCSEKKLLLKTEPVEGMTQTPQQETPVSGAVSEVSRVEKLTESQIPTRRREVKAPVPAPTPALTSAPMPTPTPPAPPTPAPLPTSIPPPAPTPQPPIKPQEVPPKGSGFVFNFDNADLYEVIRVMAEIMKMNYLIDPKVKGAVNIHTSGQISAEDVFPIFQSILKLNGATAVKKDNLYQIVPFSDAKKLPTLPATAGDQGKLPPSEKYTIEIISLKYIPVTEVSKLIKPFLSDGADIVEYPPSNILIIGDLASNVRKSLDVIGLFDIDIFTDLRVRIYPILNADVTEVAKEMERIFSSFEVSTKSGRGVGITFTPIARINSLVVVSSIPNVFEKVEGWVKELDKIPTEGSKFSVFVYYVQNAKAKDLAEVLKEVFVTAKKAESKEKAATLQPARGVRPTPIPTAPTPPAAPTEEGGAVPLGEVNIVVDETNNALVIRAFARDYRSILETIKKLDIYPRQVLIEVLLAEVTLDDANKFGIEWARFTTSNPPIAQEITLSAAPPANPFGQAIAAGAMRYSIVELGGKIVAAINAAASEDRLRVVSSPHIMASNNKEAKIQIGSSQPILTNTYTTGVTAGTTTGVVEGTIEYKDIGIILTVTPRISDGGLVTLEISIEASTVNTSAIPLGNLTNIPVFGKKTAKTILSVLEGQTIVIGGLIEETREVTKSGVPLLSKIPLLGAAFGFQSYTKKKTELLVLMTPHVITDLHQSNAITQEFKEKVEGLKKELEKKEKKKEKK
jgi:general secretion pathway protein D